MERAWDTTQARWTHRNASYAVCAGASPIALQARSEGEGPLTTPPLSGSGVLFDCMASFASRAHGSHSKIARSTGSCFGKNNVQYTHAGSSLAAIPHNVQFWTSPDSTSAGGIKTSCKLLGAQSAHVFIRHPMRPPSWLNQAQ